MTATKEWRCYGLAIRIRENEHGRWAWSVRTREHESWTVHVSSGTRPFVSVGGWCYTKREAMLRASCRAVEIGRNRLRDGKCYLDTLYGSPA